ncbi:hypothetical protein RCL1_008071 [Eukaryota sp. TZLM3-RCL]
MPSNRDYCEFFFKLDTEADNPPLSPRGRKQVSHLCQFQGCETTVLQEEKSGYVNLISHLRQHHRDFEAVYLTGTKIGSVIPFVVSTDKPSTIYGWLDWTITGISPFSFVDSELTRRYTTLKPICSNTLLKYMELLDDATMESISALLINKFGLVLDGWNDHQSHVEYVAVFAAVAGHQGLVLLSLESFEMDPDLQVNEVSNSDVFFGSEQYKELLSGVLQKYGKSTEDVWFITGDNCATNKKLANLIEVPLVGCVSHRWALE